MRIVYFGNNTIGCKVLGWLKQQGEQIVGLVIHPPERGRHAKEILSFVDPKICQVFEGTLLRKSETQSALKALKPDIGISVGFGYILRKEILSLFPRGCINLHPSYLPFNKGAYPNVWSLVEETPAGVTLHYMDEGIDTGNIIAQRPVVSEVCDTGESLYRRLETESLHLFQESWVALRNTDHPWRALEQKGAGTLHRVSDVEKIDEIDLNRSYVAKDLINIIRARTFPPYPGAYFKHKGRKVFLQLQLLTESEVKRRDDSAKIH